MKNFKLTAFLAVFLLSAFISSAWATDVTLTYKIDVQGSIIEPVAYIYNVETDKQVCTWDHGYRTLWPADEVHTMGDGYGIKFTPNQDLDKTGKNENDKSASTTAFRTEKNTTFTVSVGRTGFYFKSVTFKEDDTEKASSSNIAPNSTSIAVVVPVNKFFNYITVVLTDDIHYRLDHDKSLTVSPSSSMIYNNVFYCVAGAAITIAPTDENSLVEGVSGVSGYTIADDKRSATFTMPSENVSISATLFKIWGDGDGSEEHPYTISSTLELDTLAQRVNAGNNYSGKYFEVIQNITYTYKDDEQENNFTAIGTSDKPFKGKFNGKGKTIKGIRIDKPDDNYQGLFGYLGEGAVVDRIKLADVVITGKSNVGGIAGRNKSGEISDCTVESVLINGTEENSRNHGGIVGYNNGTVSGCVSSATLTSSGLAAYSYGGIVGSNDGTVSGCTSSATLTSSGENGDYYGGIAGVNYGTVSGCISSATLTSSGEGSDSYGGIAGANYGTVSGCTSSASLTSSGKYTNHYGGIVGYDYEGSVSNNLAKNATISGKKYCGAVLGYSYKSSLSNNYYAACTVAGVENSTNVGVGDFNSPKDVTANNGAVAVSVTALAAVENLVYNESSQELVTAGATNYGSLLYSLDGTTYSEDIPSATNAGSYTVYYRVDKDGENVILPQTIEASIAPISVLASGAVKVLEDQNGRYAEIDGNFGGSVENPNTDAVNITESIEVDRVSFNRKFSTYGFSTVVFPFEVNTSQLSGVDSVFYFAQMTYDQNGDRAVGIKKAWGTTCDDVDLKPNTPYMVQMKMDQSNIGISGSVTLVPTTPAVKQSEANDGWEFRGTYEFKQWSEGDGEVCRVYGYAATSTEEVSAGEFVKFIAGARLRPLRAYLINTNKTCATAQPAAQNAPQLARANGDNVVRASIKSAGEELPEYMNVVILGDDEEHTTIIGRINTRTGEFTSIGSNRKFDIMGRHVGGAAKKARGAYYKKNFRK